MMEEKLDTEFLQDNAFIQTLLNEIPCGVLILDQERRLLQINNIVEKAFDISQENAVGKLGGEALGCVHLANSDKPCGSGEECNKCVALRAATEALVNNRKFKGKGAFQIFVDGRAHEVTLLLSAAPFEHRGKRFAVLIIDNISKLDTLHAVENEVFTNRIIGRHKSIIELYNLLHEAAQVDLPVLIQGESGTGKELVAQAIHNASHRKDKPFIPVNCGALPHGLLESELFGHVKGAFTGAIRDKKGRFELADGGTIFLDEIGELDPAVQVKLLRVLQEKAFERIGGVNTIKVNVRLISATNKQLDEEVNADRFRLDLYYRLCVVPITVPPLRQRKEDIPLLSEHFIAKFGDQFGGLQRKVSPDTYALLQAYSWPGNIRELQNVLQFSLMKAKGAIIEPQHLPSYITHHTALIEPKKALTHKKSRVKKLDENSVLKALRKSQGNKVEAARELGVARATLYRYLNDHMDYILGEN